MRRHTEDGPTLRDIVAKHYNPIIKAIRELPKPVIAASISLAISRETIRIRALNSRNGLIIQVNVRQSDVFMN